MPSPSPSATCADYGLEERIALVQSDLFAAHAGRRYDLILANPPYVGAEALAAFPPEYAAEPAIAHAGGADGLDLVRRILAEAGDHLSPDGTLVVEIGRGRRSAGGGVSAPAVPVAGHRRERGRGVRPRGVGLAPAA